MQYEVKQSIFGRKTVIYRCAGCGAELKSPLVEAGTHQECPKCRLSFVTPGMSELKEFEAARAALLEDRLAAEQKAAQRREERLVAAKAEADRRQAELLTLLRGPVNQAMICPHCQSKGTVRTKRVSQKKGISGAKATGALLTGGFSLLATGLSRHEGATEAYCTHCKNQWVF